MCDKLEHRPGQHAECVGLCTQALAMPAVEAASGLQAQLLERRARSHTAQGAHAAALADLAAALALQPAAAACLLVRSQVRPAPLCGWPLEPTVTA